MSKNQEKTKCKCPHCDSIIPASLDLCDVCKIEFAECSNCGTKFSNKLEKCPKCGKEV